MSNESQGGRIIRLVVSNFLRVKTAEVTPDGALVIVAGNNDQGKSSVLNAIAFALSGKDHPIEPIRKGASGTHVILETDALIITRKASQSGGAVLEVRDKEGRVVASPQSALDKLVSRVTFDPFEFTRLDAAKQLETVRRVAGLDFSQLDQEFAEKFASRTEVNRAVRQQEARLSGIHRRSDAPAEEVNVESLMEQLEEAEASNRAIEGKYEALSNLNDEVDSISRQMQDAKATVLKLHEQLADVNAKRDAAKVEADAMKRVDITPIREALRNSQSVNEGVRSNRAWNDAHQHLVKVQQQSKELTERLEAIQKEKGDTLEKVKFPVDGLGFSDAGVTYKGVPFQQAGTAVKIMVSVAIARSLNPRLPVMFVRDGSLMDEFSLELLRTEAENHGLQIWLECVGNREDATVIMEEGEVTDRPAARNKVKQK